MAKKQKPQLTPYQSLLMAQIDQLGHAPDFGERTDWQALEKAGLVKQDTLVIGKGALAFTLPVYVHMSKESQS